MPKQMQISSYNACMIASYAYAFAYAIAKDLCPVVGMVKRLIQKTRPACCSIIEASDRLYVQE